jgi:hypothetical protein
VSRASEKFTLVSRAPSSLSTVLKLLSVGLNAK